MRIEKLEIGAYGCFVDRSIPNLPRGLVIIHGLNEAGKSTLFSLLTTLLYGSRKAVYAIAEIRISVSLPITRPALSMKEWTSVTLDGQPA